ncbi:Uncharacterised protein [Mycobacteroides abscessus subsp. bolletii]|nr:Uncharacterised protein [Mycobacteroides abscessus subsp. bolletii]
MEVDLGRQRGKWVSYISGVEDLPLRGLIPSGTRVDAQFFEMFRDLFLHLVRHNSVRPFPSVTTDSVNGLSVPS